MGGDNIFLVRGVTKRYGQREVLAGLSFEVIKGEILGIIGASGAGKTSLLHMLVGFVPSSSGQILFHAHTPRGIIECDVLEHHDLVNRSYGFASQQPSFYEKLTIMENLEYFGAMYDLPKETIQKNADVLLRLMELKASAHVLAQHLSGGMKRRLDIACSLIHNPSVLILDEPTADLDPVLRTQIWEIIKRINQRGTTVILSSHHLGELDTLCSRIAILKDGKLVDIDTPATLKSKYSRTQEIMVESFPGNYDSVIKSLKADDITKITREGTYLTVKTETPERVITKLLAALHRNNESLLDLKLIKPNLDTVFLTIHKTGHTEHHETESSVPSSHPPPLKERVKEQEDGKERKDAKEHKGERR
jgi:ABC-2 type transport system ATP-binding protein